MATANPRLAGLRDSFRASSLVLTLGAALGVLLVMLNGGGLATYACGAILTAALVLLVARHPAHGVMVLVPFLPFQVVLLAWLFRYGVPAPVVRGMGGVKEALTLGVVVSAAWAVSRSSRRLDTLDRIALAYLGMVTLYLLAPIVMPGLLGGQSLSVRALAWRQNCVFVLLFLGVRHAPIMRAQMERIIQVVIATGTAVAAIGIFEFFVPDAWNSFLINVAQVPRYKADVLDVVTNFSDQLAHSSAGGRSVIRPGSVLQFPVNFGFYLVLPLGLLLQRLTRRRVSTYEIVAFGVCTVGLLLSLTRSAILAFLIVAMVAITTGVRRRATGRIRLVILLLIGLVSIAPLAGSSGLVDRTTAAFSGEDASTTDHGEDLLHGLTTMVEQPLGKGLGTAAGVGDRFAVRGKVTSENAYLQVANELGVVTLAVFVGALISIAVALRRRAQEGRGPQELAAAMYAVWIALLVSGFLQQIWIQAPFAVTTWAVAGMALARGTPDADESDQALRARPRHERFMASHSARASLS